MQEGGRIKTKMISVKHRISKDHKDYKEGVRGPQFITYLYSPEEYEDYYNKYVKPGEEIRKAVSEARDRIVAEIVEARLAKRELEEARDIVFRIIKEEKAIASYIIKNLKSNPKYKDASIDDKVSWIEKELISESKRRSAINKLFDGKGFLYKKEKKKKPKKEEISIEVEEEEKPKTKVEKKKERPTLVVSQQEEESKHETEEGISSLGKVDIPNFIKARKKLKKEMKKEYEAFLKHFEDQEKSAKERGKVISKKGKAEFEKDKQEYLDKMQRFDDETREAIDAASNYKVAKSNSV
jgi:hypothetical protein